MTTKLTRARGISKCGLCHTIGSNIFLISSTEPAKEVLILTGSFLDTKHQVIQ